ncbi:MAG: adenylate/guanylate cyclase domain-containing protein [Bacteroidales bacterium]|nr:adenylate/guanylate cyclase domain-containing protein [Bacteroidales bacterium]
MEDRRLFDFSNRSTSDSIVEQNKPSFPDTLGLVKIDDTLNQEIIVSETVDNINDSNNPFNLTITVLYRLLIISFLLGLFFNIPFKIFFKKKRNYRRSSKNLYRFCRKFLLKTPLINASIIGVSFVATLIYMFVLLVTPDGFSDDLTRSLYTQFFYISLVTTLLTILFVYFWQKHRVHIKYIEFVYSDEDLKKRIFSIKPGMIKNRLWVSSFMTTFLPLTIVILYVFLSLTFIKDLGPIDKGQLKILYGNYAKISNFDIGLEGLFFVNIIDSFLMFLGIGTGILVSFIYILFFVKWTTVDIVSPVKELLYNMHLTGEGKMDNYSIVRTNDEIGELTEEYNNMSKKLWEYFSNISKINESYYRFVPKQFLDFLGKESLVDIHLGDQVQKEMTVLFNDIRSFTELSERMTPKENFDYINHYLGYMEPVIRANHGFVDKYIGDSIMALFSERAEDAINAAIEMRINLIEFNQVMGQFSYDPIDFGIGIHTGNLMLGIVGGEARMQSTVISDAVNLASRLEGLTKIYRTSIIISQDTLIKIDNPDLYNYRFLDMVKVKGKKETIYIFEILDGEPDHIKKLKIETKTVFGQALQIFKDNDYQKALKLFSEIFEINKFDTVAELYIQRCKAKIASLHQKEIKN